MATLSLLPRRNCFRENNPNWRGGRHLSWAGYVRIYQPEHSRADKPGYVREHIVIMEDHLGRPLKANEIVHHKNGIKSDNRIENLELKDDTEHRKYHTSLRMKRAKTITNQWGTFPRRSLN